MPTEEPGPVELRLGKLVGKKWKIVQKLGEGGCGAVYMAEDVATRAKVALKAESNFVAGGSVLKLEAQILRRMKGRKYVAQLIHAGRKERYCYMVMTLLGDSVEKLFRACHKEFTVSTQVRIGVHVLFGLKQLHEVGYVHRDIKPANLAIGRAGRETKIVHLLDFGLAREFIIMTDGKVEMRRERTNTLFRGTTRYCSASAHTRAEQGRPDDLWSMLYVLAEMRGPLPWQHLREKKEIGKVKLATPDVRMLARCPIQMLDIAKHLRELGYYSRPDYLMIYKAFMNVLTTYNYKFIDPYDWDLIAEQSKIRSKLKFSKAIKTIEDTSVSVEKSMDVGTGLLRGSNKGALALDCTMEDNTVDEDSSLYKDEDFSKNELGF
uniref:Protein kinase domain-containing protein n=1 Tax=Steinernema glaseri TaxID=37863 RepID=A0A1I8AXJ8_9BILA